MNSLGRVQRVSAGILAMAAVAVGGLTLQLAHAHAAGHRSGVPTAPVVPAAATPSQTSTGRVTLRPSPSGVPTQPPIAARTTAAEPQWSQPPAAQSAVPQDPVEVTEPEPAHTPLPTVDEPETTGWAPTTPVRTGQAPPQTATTAS